MDRHLRKDIEKALYGHADRGTALNKTRPKMSEAELPANWLEGQ